jgi:hypothetical protein
MRKRLVNAVIAEVDLGAGTLVEDLVLRAYYLSRRMPPPEKELEDEP